MKLKLSTELKDLANKPLTSEDGSIITLGKALALLVLAVKSDPLRHYLLAQKLFAQNEIELEKADFELCKDAATNKYTEVFGNALVAGQILSILAEVKEVKEK